MHVVALLERYSQLRTECPPLTWNARVAEADFLPLLEALIGAARAPGTPPRELTLAAHNIVVPPESFDPEHPDACIPVGEYVGISVRGPGAWTSDWTWRPGTALPASLPEDCREALPGSGVRYAYGRSIPPESSVMAFLPRLDETASG